MNHITNYDMSSSVNIFFKKNMWCKFQLHHCVKSIRIRSYSGLLTITPNTDTFRAVHAIDKGQGTNFSYFKLLWKNWKPNWMKGKVFGFPVNETRQAQLKGQTQFALV